MLLSLVKIIMILVAAVILGNWFLAEVRKAHKSGAPWYAPYVSIPGILIFLVILIPVLMRVLND